MEPARGRRPPDPRRPHGLDPARPRDPRAGRRPPVPPFDRFAQFRESEGKPLAELLAEFARVRAESLATLRAWRLGEAQLALEGEHPEFGAVTLRQLLATWVAHDLGHVVQVARVMAKQYGEAVGPWRAYLSVLGGR
ncbi:MAG: DinB family protein [Candidatus Eisenbacteria bacterium]